MDPNQQQQQQQPQQGNDQSEDYLDKGLDFIETKFGQGKIDPVKMRDTNEKITDGARGMFEKFTGKKVPEKFSN
ncbi:hypothetical protein TMatcc_004692 [Talaromyces marneffei ATCC 18224]|uniref:Uncharacterized protein n=2 Tax=Talaromyces marneffei TaxID=37727 RepID=B6Q345_TALMQ|nr:uncharacterized protein EYB26_000380 [Talaromyces marneffei]EEA27029.1 conserved hypothetical protein [Talaromyces marneffei ATCC 18224]KAE8557247.1 hypothetical protein EYB25_001953 [Talaromyces marneffei]QGA12735.1 hypothetical protein EYB26_000380 [Talaromyces marneffei]